MSTHNTWPSEDESRRLVARLLAGDPTAAQEIAFAFFGPLTDFLRCKFPKADPHAWETAAGDAILSVVSRPGVYNPARGPLGAFLRMAAKRDLYNLLKKSARHRGRISLGSVAEPADRWNTFPDDDPELTWDDPRLVSEVATFEPSELVVFRLMRDGERDTAVFARALGLSGKPAELAAEVKRLKDRIKKRLTRAVGGAA
jgi:DNA-directed RNA polymerase specialized sigma24 family protein